MNCAFTVNSTVTKLQCRAGSFQFFDLVVVQAGLINVGHVIRVVRECEALQASTAASLQRSNYLASVDVQARIWRTKVHGAQCSAGASTQSSEVATVHIKTKAPGFYILRCAEPDVVK